MQWWTPLELGDGSERTVRIGQLHLRVARRASLYRLAWRFDDEPEGTAVQIDPPQPAAELDDSFTVERVTASEAGELRLRPAVADRPIVARPDMPFTVGPKAQVTVFVNTPVWLSIEAGRRLRRLPTMPSKPTWFGTNREGQPCYAMRTHLRLEQDQVTRRPHRALAPLRIVNDGDDPLQVDRVRIPAPNLPIHADAEDNLWLPEIVLTRRESQEDAVLTLGARRREPALTDAIEPMTDSAVVRAFNSIFR